MPAVSAILLAGTNIPPRAPRIIPVNSPQRIRNSTKRPMPLGRTASILRYSCRSITPSDSLPPTAYRKGWPPGRPVPEGGHSDLQETVVFGARDHRFAFLRGEACALAMSPFVTRRRVEHMNLSPTRVLLRQTFMHRIHRNEEPLKC